MPANSPHKTMDDLVKAFKANPGKVSWGGGSAGGTDHILVGLIAKAVGVDPAKVNYVAVQGRRRGGGGDPRRPRHGRRLGHRRVRRADQGGQDARARACPAPTQVEGIPSLKEQGIDVELGNWRGVFGAPGHHARSSATRW